MAFSLESGLRPTLLWNSDHSGWPGNRPGCQHRMVIYTPGIAAASGPHIQTRPAHPVRCPLPLQCHRDVPIPWPGPCSQPRAGCRETDPLTSTSHLHPRVLAWSPAPTWMDLPLVRCATCSPGPSLDPYNLVPTVLILTQAKPYPRKSDFQRSPHDIHCLLNGAVSV